MYPGLSKEFILITDSSGQILRGVLTQDSEKKHNLFSYWSRVLTPTEERYPAYEREALVIYEAIKHYL